MIIHRILKLRHPRYVHFALQTGYTYHRSQVCHKDRDTTTIIIVDNHPIYEKTRNKNTDI